MNKLYISSWSESSMFDKTIWRAFKLSSSKDKNDYYYNGEKLNVDIKTFEYTLEGNCIKWKDKNKIYKYNCDK